MKDYYDLYYLASKFNFDGSTLTEALKKTFENREHKFTLEQFKRVMSFRSDDAMQIKWKTFTRKIDTKTDNFDTVLAKIEAFLTKSFTAVIKSTEFTEQWIVAESQWSRKLD